MKKMLMSYLVNMLLYTKIWSEQFLRNVKKISVSESDIDLNEHFKNFSDVYFSQLSPKELALINRKSYSSETRNDNSSAIVIPEDFIMQIKSIMFDANVNLLTEK